MYPILHPWYTFLCFYCVNRYCVAVMFCWIGEICQNVVIYARVEIQFTACAYVWVLFIFASTATSLDESCKCIFKRNFCFHWFFYHNLTKFQWMCFKWQTKKYMCKPQATIWRMLLKAVSVWPTELLVHLSAC